MSLDPATLIGTAIGMTASSLFSSSTKPYSYSAPSPAAIPPPPTVGLPAAYSAPAAQEIKPTPTPNAPINAADTAALQRARAGQKGNGGPSSLVLSSIKSRNETTSTGAPGALVSRTTLLGR